MQITSQVQLKKSNVTRVMTVTTTNNERGTVKFNGKTLVVVRDGISWKQV